MEWDGRLVGPRLTRESTVFHTTGEAPRVDREILDEDSEDRLVVVRRTEAR